MCIRDSWRIVPYTVPDTLAEPGAEKEPLQNTDIGKTAVPGTQKPDLK